MRLTWLTKLIVVGGIGALACVPFMGVNQFWVFFITITMFQTMLLASLNLTLGYAGLVSLGHNALYAVGGYATAYFTVSRGVPVLLGIFLGMVFGALAGTVLALPAYRARAVYFGIITLSFLFIVTEVVTKWQVLGGFRGFPNIPGLEFGDFRFGRNDYYWLALGLFVISLGLLQQLSNSAIGRAFVAVRENEPAASSLGINVFGTKVMNLAISGGLAGLAGALFAHVAGGIFPEASSFIGGFRLFVAITVGGVGTFAGPLVGTAVVATVDRFTVNWVTAQPIIFGLMLIGSLAVLRLGIVGTVLTSRFRKLFVTIPNLGPKLDVDDLAEMNGQTPAKPKKPKRSGGRKDVILRVEGLSKSFEGVHALVDVDITVKRGTIHGLIGPNGSGKSTFVNCVTGYLRRNGGRIEFDGNEILHPHPHTNARNGMVRIFQRAETFGRLLVIQNVVMGLHLRSDRNLVRCVLPLPGRRRHERRLIMEALEILSGVGLAEHALSPVRDLPYGQQRLVEIARAIATRPKLLILDEPATGLTAFELEKLGSMLRSLKDEGLTILIIEHNMEFLMDLVDQITVLERGQCIAVGKPEKIQQNSDVIEAYLGERVSA